MFLGNIRDDTHSNCRPSHSEPHLTSSFVMHHPKSNSLLSSSTNIRTPMISQQTMMNYARMSYRYTTVTLLSMRPPPEITIFPDHLVERRFLDQENYIDLDRMLAEKGGKFRLDFYNMRDGAGDGPILPNRINKYDFSDPVVIEKVKNRRPKDTLTPHQVAALTSVVTRHQSPTIPTPLLSPHQIQSSRSTGIQRTRYRNNIPRQSSLFHSTHNLHQYDRNINPITPLLPHYQTNTKPIPILQRLFQAQQRQQNEQQRAAMHNNESISISEQYHKGSSAFCTPSSPQQSNTYATFAWPFPTNQNQRSVIHPLHIPLGTQATVKQNQDVLTHLINDHLRCSTTMQTPTTPNVDISRSNNLNPDNNDDDDDDDDDDDEQNFYSAPPSPTQQQDPSPSLFSNSSNPEHNRIYNQAVLLNSLIRNMVNDNNIQNSSSNESCFSNHTQSTNFDEEKNESYTEMYNLIRLLSPGVKTVAQQELLEYLEQGCLNERNEMLRLIGSLNLNEQNSLKPILLRLINEQIDVMKKQQNIQHGNSIDISHRYSQEIRSPLESWFGSDIYKNAYPQMPSDRVISACDLEQSRLTQHN